MAASYTQVPGHAFSVMRTVIGCRESGMPILSAAQTQCIVILFNMIYHVSMSVTPGLAVIVCTCCIYLIITYLLPLMNAMTERYGMAIRLSSCRLLGYRKPADFRLQRLPKGCGSYRCSPSKPLYDFSVVV